MTIKLYPASFITQFGLCHLNRTRLFIQLVFIQVLRPSSSSNLSLETFLVIRNNLQIVEMNSSHSKTAMTFLALCSLHSSRAIFVADRHRVHTALILSVNQCEHHVNIMKVWTAWNETRKWKIFSVNYGIDSWVQSWVIWVQPGLTRKPSP